MTKDATIYRRGLKNVKYERDCLHCGRRFVRSLPKHLDIDSMDVFCSPACSKKDWEEYIASGPPVTKELKEVP